MKPHPTILHHAQILWRYHHLDLGLVSADFVLALGSHDERVAAHAVDLVLKGWAPLLVVSGGFGKVTRNSWAVSEGERFASIAEGMGVERSRIIVENQAANTGDNLTLSRALLRERGIDVQAGILVTKPYMRRRAYATAACQWPEINWRVSAPPLDFENYPTPDVPLDTMIHLMVGDLQRMKLYAEQGFQIPQEIPAEVWESYIFLRDAGFDAYIIKT